MDETGLGEIGVVFDLEGGGFDLGVAQQIHDEGADEIADADTFCQALLHQTFHGGPGLLDGGIARDDILAVVGEAGGVTSGGVDVFEGDGEVHDVKVEVVDLPVFELFLADGFNAIVVVEGVPELGDEEEIGALDEAVFNSSGYSFAAFGFIAVV